MYKIHPGNCRKCGGEASIHWDHGEKSSGMDIKPLRPSGMRKVCSVCGFTETIDDLENRVDAAKK
jgi:hypothetical protein